MVRASRQHGVRGTSRAFAVVLAAVLVVAVATTGAPGAGAVDDPSGALVGTVTEAGTGAPVAGAWVTVLRAHDFQPAAEVVADGAGAFTADLPAGSYFAYLIDPSGTHAPQFVGGPELLRVRSGEVVDATSTMASTTGTVTGVVTDATSDAVVAGVWVLVLGPSGAPERAVRTDSAGRYLATGVATGTHRLAFLDPTAAHVTTFYDGAGDAGAATPVEVTAGATVTASTTLARQSTSQALTSLDGTITDSVTSAALGDVLVLALRSTDLRLAGAATTPSTGRYQLNVPVGSYELAFVDTSGAHAMEWYADRGFDGLALAQTVTAPATVDAALAPTTGTLDGGVRDGDTGAPVAGAWVLAVDAGGRMRGSITDASGAFQTTGLPPGTYRAAIIDATGDRRLEYWDDEDQFATADTFAITAGATTSIESDLEAPAPGLLDEATGWWEAGSGLLPDGTLPDLSGHGHDLELRAGVPPSYAPALLAPDPGRGRHLFSPGWDDMYLDTPAPPGGITTIDVAWDADLDRALDVNAGKDVNWVVHQGSSADGTFSWAVGVVAATGQVEVRWSADGTTVSSLRSTAGLPTGTHRIGVVVDPASGDLTVYHQGAQADPAAFDAPYDSSAWSVLDRVAGTGPVVLHQSDRPVRHSSAIPRDQIGDSTGEGWFTALYRLRVRSEDQVAAAFDVGLVPAEPTWSIETGLPPLYPTNADADASRTSFPGGAGETWTIHNYLTPSYPILLVDRPYVLFGNHSYGVAGADDADFGIEPGEDFSVWIAYAYPRIGGSGGPLVAVKQSSADVRSPGWAIMGSPFFAGPSAVVSDGTTLAYDPAPPASDSQLDVSGFQVDGAAQTLRSYTNGAPSAGPVSIAGLGPLLGPAVPLTVAGYGDGAPGPSVALAALVVFPRQLTPAEIAALPAELGLAG